ncbi:MAG: hypothetical protein PHU23_02305 [Dehalococcoidales bacterium]|nr:hypothetical protein [Dehalococcoidales bacterium]
MGLNWLAAPGAVHLSILIGIIMLSGSLLVVLRNRRGVPFISIRDSMTGENCPLPLILSQEEKLEKNSYPLSWGAPPATSDWPTSRSGCVFNPGSLENRMTVYPENTYECESHTD